MDSGSDCSAFESVEDNGLTKGSSHPVDYCKIQKNGSCLGEAEKLVSEQNFDTDKVPGNNKEEKGLEPSETVSFGSLGAKSPGGATSPTTKGHGLKKWRRIRRDLVKNTSASIENGKFLKRGLSASANPPFKPSQYPSSDVKQNNGGSVGPVHLPKTIDVADEFTLPESSPDSRFAAGLAFAAGTDSENSEDQSSKSSTAASTPNFRYDLSVGYAWDIHPLKNLGGKSVGNSSGQSVQRGKSGVENSKKPRGERIKIEKENSHSSMESDSRSSNFVMQGAFTIANSGDNGGRIMDYDGGNSDEAYANGQSAYRKQKLGEETVDLSLEDSVSTAINGNNCSFTDQYQLAESIEGWIAVQELLEKEIQIFCGIGKETTSFHYDPDKRSSVHATSLFTDPRAGEPSSSHQSDTGTVGQSDLVSLESKVLTLTNTMKHLETKLVETRATIKVKESRISDLEATLNFSKSSEEEIEHESLFQQKIEAEIEYLTLTRSIENLKVPSGDRLKLFEEQNAAAGEQREMLNKLGEAESKAAELKKHAEELEKQCGDFLGTEEVTHMRRNACKVASCFFIQLILLVLAVWLFLSKLFPDSEMVVPT